MNKIYLIEDNKTLLDALKRISEIATGPLVLFVVNDKDLMVGTLTNGDARRALIAGKGVTDTLDKVMHRNFNYLRQGVNDDVAHIREQKELKMKLVPVLDKDDHIVEIINLDRYRTKLPIDAVLMAGGKGIRLRPLTETTPKPLLKVGNKAIIDYNINSLISFGVKHISVTVNYLHEQIEEHFKEEYDGVKVNCVREPKYLGTIGSLKFIEHFYNDTVLVMNSDLFTNINFEDFYLHFEENDADMSIAAVPYTVSVPYGIFELKGREVKGVLEKPTYNYYANAGIYLIKKELLQLIPEDTFFNATDLIDMLIQHGNKVIRYPLNGTWIDIGNPQEYQKAKELVKHLDYE